MKKKVLIWESLDYLGGGQKLAVEIAEALKNTYDVSFLLPGEGKLSQLLAEKGFSYRCHFQKKMSRGKKNIFDILKFFIFSPFVFVSSLYTITKIKPDLIYANGAPTFIFASIVGLLLNRPVIWHAHHYFQDRKTVQLLNIFGRLNSVRRIICESAALEEQYIFVNEKVTSICPGIYLEDYAFFNKNNNIRNELSIPTDTKIIIQIGWVVKVKGQHILIEAAKHVYEKRKDIVFLIIGKNLPGEEDYLKGLRQKIDDYRLKDVVRILGFYDDTKSLMDEAFVNIIASFEGFSLVMLEAAALNLPTIGPNVGGPGVVIEDGISGLIYNFEDPLDLAEKILFLIENEEFYRKMRESTAEFVSKYTVQQYHHNILHAVEYTF